MKIFTSTKCDHAYTSEKLFEKLRRLPDKILAHVTLKAFLFHELLKGSDTPVAVKAAIIATLGYLIMPLDGIPDPLPGGFVDDIALMAGLLASLNYLVTAELKKRAEDRVTNLTSDGRKEVDEKE